MLSNSFGATYLGDGLYQLGMSEAQQQQLIGAHLNQLYGMGQSQQSAHQGAGGTIMYSGGSYAYGMPTYDRAEEKQITREKSMFGFKDYVKKYSDLIWTITFVLLLDHVILKGALRSKVQDSVEGFLAKIKKEHE